MHKEGTVSIIVTIILLGIINAIIYLYANAFLIPTLIISIGFFIFILNFFRNPNRGILEELNGTILCPADGKVVVIEETVENEYLKDKRLQVSIFMNPLNVHVNRNPVSGIIKYYKYHSGKYLAAWNPKSSTENERTTIVYQTGEHKVLMRQIAGALARRIVCYAKEGDSIRQGDDIGFIKLGSRVDLFLPLGTEVLVELDQVVKGNITQIAKLP